jgi:hypothetical protein
MSPALNPRNSTFKRSELKGTLQIKSQLVKSARVKTRKESLIFVIKFFVNDCFYSIATNVEALAMWRYSVVRQPTTNAD